MWLPRENEKSFEDIHRQFGHADKDKLVKLIVDSNIDDKELFECIKKVCDECYTCENYKPTKLKPIVSLPLAQEFNAIVCVDLKDVDSKTKIMHMIDAATRYSAARVIPNKNKSTIVVNTFSMWVAYFGKPGKLMCDNGGEFDNHIFTEMSEKLGIEMQLSPAESPFTNGIVERHNRILAETMLKTRQDTGCSSEVALAWALSAKNSLHNSKGFSSNQLVFGHNVNLPTVLRNEIPALERTSSSDIIRKIWQQFTLLGRTL